MEFGFDICASALCQLYRAGRAQVAEDGYCWAAAVAATAGTILLSGGTPALAVYHSTAGATTRSIEDVWGGEAIPYLRAVEVPPQDSPFASWSYDACAWTSCWPSWPGPASPSAVRSPLSPPW